jgi:poly(hydroxyalkanoate) granule-associated protein
MQMVKKVKGNVDSQLSQSVQESAHLIWLAGLGAFAKVSDEGARLFDTLVKEGEKIEERTRQSASTALAEVRESAGETRGAVADAWDKVEQVFEERLARVLGRLGVPGRDDVQELVRRIDALQAHIEELRQARDAKP